MAGSVSCCDTMRTRDPEKQKKIKEATVRLILREGINGASVAKIAREAEVSPATIYVYYDSKESMLSEIFQEYSDQSYRYLLRRVDPSMDGAAVIESLVRGYYDYTLEHQEVYSFVEQCSRCPGLAEYVSEPDCCCGVFDVLHAYQKRGELKAYSDLGLAAVLFAPVQFLARSSDCMQSAQMQLDELVAMLQDLLLIR